MKIRIKKIRLLFSVLILQGCGHIQIEHEFNNLKNRTRHTFDQQIERGNPHSDSLAQFPETTVTQGLTRDEAVSIALQNNPTLRAEFEHLGIAKADLVQAGLYTNPTLDGIFAFPQCKNNGNAGGSALIDIYGTMKISDFWIVPLTKQVAEDVLEITSLRIMTAIINSISSTKNAYDYCLYIESKLKIMRQLLDTTIKLNREITYQQKYGYTTDYDIGAIRSKTYALKSDVEETEQLIKRAYIELYESMGLGPQATHIKLSDSLALEKAVPTLHAIQDYAFENHPELLIARTKIVQFADTVRAEKAKAFKNVNAGFSYQREFHGTEKGWGPAVILDIPIFDTNYAQVAKAEFLLNQAQEALIASDINIKSSISKAYEALTSARKQINHYKKALSASKKATDEAYKYVATMQLNAITALQFEIAYHEQTLQNLDLHLKSRQEVVNLERATGKKLTLTNQSPTIS